MSGSVFYGMTEMGGANNDGVIFEYGMQPTALKTKTENFVINIFPNPAHDYITVTTNEVEIDHLTVSLYDIQGHLLIKQF